MRLYYFIGTFSMAQRFYNPTVPEHADCVKTNMGYTCTCRDGYSMVAFKNGLHINGVLYLQNSGICVDVDECASEPCGPEG